MPWNYHCSKCGAALDPGERCDCEEKITPAKETEITKTFNGKPVLTRETFDYDTVKIGDYVEQQVVDDAMDCLPPACMRSSCSQMGEPYSHRQDPDTGKWRATYATFKRVAGEWPHAIWEYCGHCFAGENVERGKDPIYC